MRFAVVDACVAVKWFVKESGTDAALELLDNENLLFVAPDIFYPEVVSAFLKQHRAGHLTSAVLDQALRGLDAVLPQIVSSGPLMERAVEIARELSHPIYDCLYLALAERWDIHLVTADRAFMAICRSKLSGEWADRLVALGEPFPA